MKNKELDIYLISEEDFYPPSDDRILTSYIYDIEDSESFEDYCVDFFSMLDNEEYFQ